MTISTTKSTLSVEIFNNNIPVEVTQIITGMVAGRTKAKIIIIMIINGSINITKIIGTTTAHRTSKEMDPMEVTGRQTRGFVPAGVVDSVVDVEVDGSAVDVVVAADDFRMAITLVEAEEDVTTIMTTESVSVMIIESEG